MDKAQKQCASWKKCDASYPSWIVPKDTVEIIYLTPVRMFYFLYAPFPWNIKKTIHLIGLIESFFYIFYQYVSFEIGRFYLKTPKHVF